MHGPIEIPFPLPLHVVGDVRHFHTFVETFKYIPNSSHLLQVDYYSLGNNGQPYSDHAIVYSPARLGRYLENTREDQLWAFTQMLDQINAKHKAEHNQNLTAQEFTDVYGTVFVRDRFLSGRTMHVTPLEVYEHWETSQQKQHIAQAIAPTAKQKMARKI